MFYSHVCPECGYKKEDLEKLLCCPDCSSDKITNDIPVKDFSDEFVEEDEQDQ